MKATLDRLKELMPPPKKPRFAHVNWERVEHALKLVYPTSFKDFIGVYGGSVWFDNLSPFYTEAQTDSDVKTFLRSVAEKLKPLKGNMYDEDFNSLELPLFPDPGGLLPFMIDYAGNLYAWPTEKSNPEKWPVAVWLTGTIRVIEGVTIASMIVDWLQRKPLMMELWGDLQEFAPDRLRLTETSETSMEKKKKRRKS